MNEAGWNGKMKNLGALSEIWVSPMHLVGPAASLMFAIPLQPAETATDEDPPGWDKREEGWSIEELLGQYNSQKKTITLFNKGIKHAAEQLIIPVEGLRYVVRLHEWGHAVFHLGVNRGVSAELAGAMLADDDDLIESTVKELTKIYNSVQEYVHEQIAQVITKLALEELRAGATFEESKAASETLLARFETLTKRQPPRYRIDQFRDLKREHLQSRLQSVIGLIREDCIRGNEKTWNTIMAW
jgi:hypothetical protein